MTEPSTQHSTPPPSAEGGHGEKNWWLVFAAVAVWKLALFLFSAQPVPANDSFFYDGPVVNYVLNGKYVNPSLALVLPISSTEVFSAYPPLYQFFLCGWMFAFGTSVLSAMAFHLALFALYMAILLAILRRLGAPAWCINVAGGFLLLLTFHDRPDSLAQVLGMLAVYCWVRSWPGVGVERTNARWIWAAAVCVILTLCASLQIGGTYFLIVWLGIAIASWVGKEKLPLAPLAVMTLVPLVLVATVRSGFPNLWAGFREHAAQTPFLIGLHVPQVVDLLKVLRTVSAVLLVGLLVARALFRNWQALGGFAASRHGIVMIAVLLPALAVTAASLSVLSPNTVGVSNYLQPLIVGSFLAWSASLDSTQAWKRRCVLIFSALILVGSIRAVGMTTWGLACATDVSYRSAIQRVKQELESVPSTSGRKMALSSAYLYEAARHRDITWIHSDWLDKSRPGVPENHFERVVAVKPDKMILTQFDYYRRYQPVIEQLKARDDLVEVRLVNTAKIPAPDSIASLQRVVQHLSWAPVIVSFSWK